MADSQTFRVKAARTADPHTAFHVPVQAEKTLFRAARCSQPRKNTLHHALRPAHADTVKIAGHQLFQEVCDQSMVPLAPVVGGNREAGIPLQDMAEK